MSKLFETTSEANWDDTPGGVVPIQRVLARELSEAELQSVSGEGYNFHNPDGTVGLDFDA